MFRPSKLAASKLIWPAVAMAALIATSGLALPPPQPVPEVAVGFTISPLAPMPAATALAFGPGDADGPDLYATTLGGDVFRLALAWTVAGPVVTGVATFASGFSLPLGLVFGPEGALYVSDSHDGPESGQTDGRITRLDAGDASQADGAVIVDGLPQGQHNTNHLRFGPDGRLYMANGNPNDHGNGTGSGNLDLFPYSGALLSASTGQVTASPAVLHYEDANGDPIAFDQIGAHPINADFASKVNVLAYGFRNIFGLAFAPGDLPFGGTAYTAMNGADSPSSQDALFRVTPGENYDYPFCYNVGVPGGVGSAVSADENPDSPNPARTCEDTPTATALLGWHTCATGIDFPTDGPHSFSASMQQSVFVGECAFFFPEPDKILADPPTAYHSTSHKVVRVALDATGEATEVRDFVTGLALPTDVLFGPDGAMYIADVEMLYRVAPAL